MSLLLVRAVCVVCAFENRSGWVDGGMCTLRSHARGLLEVDSTLT